MIKKLKAYLQLIRIQEWRIYIAALLRMITGAVFGYTIYFNKIDILLACGTIISCTAGILSINDFFDKDIDKINSPQRPIPSGRVGHIEVLLISGFLFLSSLLFSILINFWCFMITFITIILAVLYPILKRKGIIGHLTIGTISSMAILFGGAVMNNLSSAVILITITVFLYFMVVNIITSLKDIKGDKASDAYTLPVTIGPYKAVFYSAPFLLLGVFINIFLYFNGNAHIFIIPSLLVFDGWLLFKFKKYLKLTPKDVNFLLDKDRYKDWVYEVALKLNFNIRSGAVVFFLILISAKVLLFF